MPFYSSLIITKNYFHRSDKENSENLRDENIRGGHKRNPIEEYSITMLFVKFVTVKLSKPVVEFKIRL